MHQYIKNNQDRFVSELIELLKVPSISADPAYKESVLNTAELVKKGLLAAGADTAELMQTPGYPIVYGEKFAGEGKPTVLIYGHYDVQPPDPLNLWTSPPFEPVVKDNKIYARGACDDKGQFFMHVKALELLLQEGELPCNLKFMIEGEEEVGSENLGWFLKHNKEKLAADVILVSDTSIFSMENPSITVGLRGLSYMEVEVTGPNRDLHSGVYGGAVINPINALCQMITKLIDDEGRITIPHFYDDVVELSAEDRAAMAKAPFSEKDWMDDLGIDGVRGEKGYSTLERKSIRPTCDVNGIWGGYTGEGAKTVIASKAYAKISMRLVPNQDSKTISDLFKEYFESLAPAGIQVKVSYHHGGQPAVTPTDSVAYKAAHLAFEQVWGKTPLPMREGGSIPIVSLFESELGLKTVLMGFGLDSDAIHSPNEHYGIDNFLLGIETIAAFHKNFAELSK